VKFGRTAPSAALVILLIALFAALGGTTHAAASLPRSSAGPAQLRNGAVTGGAIRNSAVTGRGSGNTSVTIGADGLPVVAYRNYGVLEVLHCGDQACSADNSATTIDSGQSVDGDVSITIGVDGLPLIGYYDATNGALKVAHCGNAACSSGNTIATVDNNGDVGLSTSVTRGPDGLPLISYHDATNGALKVAHCGDAACSSGNTITTVDGGGVGAGSSVTVGADALPLISYSANTNEVRVLHCGNAACSSGNTIATVDTITVPSFVASVVDTSVTVGTDGLPLITYDIADPLPDYFTRVGHCGNTVCNAGNTLTVAGCCTLTAYTSVTIGADGLPLISYIDLWDGFLMVEHCPNASCLTTVVKLDISKNGTGSGTVSSIPTGIQCGTTCSESFYTGDWVTLTATPSEGSRFSGWSGGGCSGTGNCQIKNLAGDQSVTATFSLIPETLTVAKAGKGSGTVSSSPAGISCGSSCSHAYNYGSSVSLTANAGKGSSFSGWSGACSGKAACAVSMNAVRSVRAAFVKKCSVPKLKNKTLRKARLALKTHDCSLGKVEHSFSSTVKKGHVVSQKPGSGKQLNHGAKVRIVLSKGKKH
jgi:hypothetical protein